MFSDRVDVSGDAENPLTLLIRQVQVTAFRTAARRADFAQRFLVSLSVL
jgi:hypothetical protein